MERMKRLELESAQLRTRILQAEEERAETLGLYRQQIVELQAENGGYKADADRRERIMEQLEYDLTMANKTTYSLQHVADEKEQSLHHQVKSLQGMNRL